LEWLAFTQTLISPVVMHNVLIEVFGVDEFDANLEGTDLERVKGKFFLVINCYASSARRIK